MMAKTALRRRIRAACLPSTLSFPVIAEQIAPCSGLLSEESLDNHLYTAIQMAIDCRIHRLICNRIARRAFNLD